MKAKASYDECPAKLQIHTCDSAVSHGICKGCGRLPGSAKDTADQIDSEILLDILREAGAKLDDGPVPLIGRHFYNPITDKVEAVE